MKKTIFLTTLGALLGLGSALAESECSKVSLSVKAAVAAEQTKVLEIVTNEVSASPDCSCEVVKAAIEGSGADVKTVAAITEVAILAAPDQMRLIAQCAIAAAPDALVEVQAVLAKLDPNAGDSGQSAKSGKSAKGAKAPIGEVAAMPNPLDFPGKGPDRPLFPVFTPSIFNVIDPDGVSDVDPDDEDEDEDEDEDQDQDG